MSSANPAVAAALTAVESRRAAQRQAELEELESDLDDNEVSSDESDEEEDEYGEELTPAMDAAILRTLRLIRSGKGVYEGEKVIEGEFELAGLGDGSGRAVNVDCAGGLRGLSGRIWSCLIVEALKDTSIQAETLKLNHPRAQAATKVSLSLTLNSECLRSNLILMFFPFCSPPNQISDPFSNLYPILSHHRNHKPKPHHHHHRKSNSRKPHLTEIHLARPPTCRPPSLFPLQLRFRPARSLAGHAHPPDPRSGRETVTGRSD